MKYLLLSIVLLSSLNCFAQDPDPDLFQTWYLDLVFATDSSPVYEVSEIDPPITPFLTILGDLSYNGEGACNSFTGTYSSATAMGLETLDFSNTMDDCGEPIHNNFEASYFNTIAATTGYEITSDADGLLLRFSTPLMGRAYFRNYELSTEEFDFNQIITYPNPTSSSIFIEDQNNAITKIEIFNIYGQTIKIVKDGFENIDVSDLSSGIYIMNIFTEFGSVTKKIEKI